jgi:hypothetical protein
MLLNEVIQLLRSALEASVYVAPTDHGLTLSELCEVGKRAGLKQGEIDDALPQVLTLGFGRSNERHDLPVHYWSLAASFSFREDPELRNVEAFDFVVSQLNELAREQGAGKARIDRSTMVNRAFMHGIERKDVELAITLLVFAKQLIQEDGILRLAPSQGGARQLPSEEPAGVRHTTSKAQRQRLMPYVKDVIDRRTDGRPQSAEPFEAFAEQLEGLGYGHFRLWWSQTVNELGRAEPVSSPLSALVLAAALVEGALTFVVKHARASSLGSFGSTDYDGPPTQWRIEGLVTSAARGGDAAVLSPQAKIKADWLVRARQRIHAGRMLVEFPNGVPDLRPEEAREANVAAQLVVRNILDWLDKHPTRRP